MLEIILTVFQTICSVALIVVVLLQSGKEAGLSGALSGSSGSLDKMLAKSTKWIALVWVVLTLVLGLFRG